MADVSDNPYAWSTTAGNNQPGGTTTIGSGLDDNLRTIQAGVRALFTPLGTVAGTNTITAVAAKTITAYGAGQKFSLTPAATNTGATTINIDGVGAKNIFSYGSACVGGELKIGVPCEIEYDGTQFNITSDRLLGVVQRVYSEYTANADLTTVIPYDDTIPQITEGTEVLTAAITPKSATNRIRIRFQCFGQNSGAGQAKLLSALFVDATANALCASCSDDPHTTGVAMNNIMEYEESAASTTARTYRIRVGPHTADTIRLNGTTAARRFGGVARATLIVEEIA